MRHAGSATVALAAILALTSAAPVAQQPAPAGVLDDAAPPGANYDKAEFRFWMPPGAATARAIVVLVPGSNGDGRSMATDAFWQEFATRHALALVACRFTDKPHEQSFIEHYVNVSQGSGEALVDAIGRFAERSKHPELSTAPLYMWGMSAGGQFNYEFVAWKPERVAAFVVNKGGIYYTALAPKAARDVPGLLFVGETDLEFRNHTIAGLFAVNRRAGARWALTQEPGIAHAVGRSRELGAMLFEEVPPLKPLDTTAGFIGDLKAQTFRPAAEAGTLNVPTAWLATERLARGWQAVITGKPFN
jgi:poly(3-hydroxybutyrate) depolymerase